MSSIAPAQHTTGQKSYTDDWITPKHLIEKLGPFDLDPCSCISQPWPCAETNWTIKDDGLFKKWFGFVWCNPPYGKNTSSWLRKMGTHNNGIALIFARTETKMFFDSIWGKGTCLLFLRGRLTFHRPDGNLAKANSGGPSVLVGFGIKAWAHLSHCRDLGALVKELKQ
jgi:hypothetical protein